MSALRVLLPTVRPHDLVRFYVDGLGLVVERSWDDPGNQGWLLRVGGEAYIEVLAGNDHYPAGPVGAIQLAVGVDDVDRAVTAASVLGASIAAAPADMPWGLRSATVRDPDGNLVNLFAPLHD
ncbi:MAG: VOC family protein [Acidimicrobiia bacterium]